MHKIEADRKKNRLVIHLNGFQNSNREILVSDIERAVADLALGFSCIILLSKDARIADKEYQDLENLLYAYGLKTIVYVGGRRVFSTQSDTGFSCSRAEIEVYQVSSLKDAEKVLLSSALPRVDRLSAIP